MKSSVKGKTLDEGVASHMSFNTLMSNIKPRNVRDGVLQEARGWNSDNRIFLQDNVSRFNFLLHRQDAVRWMALSKTCFYTRKGTQESLDNRIFPELLCCKTSKGLSKLIVNGSYKQDMCLNLNSVGPDAELGFLQLTVCPGFFIAI